jgi:hypothetical protein
MGYDMTGFIITDKRAFAKDLAQFYAQNGVLLAGLCDDLFDRTGELLGFVRTEAIELDKRLREDKERSEYLRLKQKYG